jgi:hypothetical protein
MLCPNRSQKSSMPKAACLHLHRNRSRKPSDRQHRDASRTTLERISSIERITQSTSTVDVRIGISSVSPAVRRTMCCASGESVSESEWVSGQWRPSSNWSIRAVTMGSHTGSNHLLSRVKINSAINYWLNRKITFNSIHLFPSTQCYY